MRHGSGGGWWTENSLASKEQGFEFLLYPIQRNLWCMVFQGVSSWDSMQTGEMGGPNWIAASLCIASVL